MPSGRAPWEPTKEQRQMVTILHAHGISHTTIARNIGIDPKTLRRAFREELRNARENVKSAMIAALIRAGIAGNVNAIRYWLTCWGGPEWKPPAGYVALNEETLGGGGSNTTIIIRGGLPPQIVREEIEPDDEAPSPTRQPRANGQGNGAAGTDH